MNRQEKQSIIDAVKKDFQGSQAAFVVGTKGMDVASVHKLRTELYAKKGSMRVVKNTLLKRATSDMAGLSDLDSLFSDQIAVVFATEEAPAIAKVLFEMAKEGKILTIRGGALDARLISSAQVESLALLPSREVLLARLCGTLKAPITNYVILLNELLGRFVRVLKQIENAKH
jgi:large subunit ribosomal protein L10